MNKRLPPEQLFDEISRFVADSRALLEKDAMMELAGLDSRVQMLCDAVLQLKQEERLQYAERLQALFTELKSLGESMAAQRDAMAQAVQQLPMHQKASVAYRTADAADKKKSDK